MENEIMNVNEESTELYEYEAEADNSFGRGVVAGGLATLSVVLIGKLIKKGIAKIKAKKAEKDIVEADIVDDQTVVNEDEVIDVEFEEE